jgi:hypothetical protein
MYTSPHTSYPSRSLSNRVSTFAPADSGCISLADCARQGHSKQSERKRKHKLAHKESRAMIQQEVQHRRISLALSQSRA